MASFLSFFHLKFCMHLKEWADRRTWNKQKRLCHLFEKATEYIITGKWVSNVQSCRSQWPRSLRRTSTAARLPRLWFRIPPVAWMSVVTVMCCQVEVSATSWSLVQRSPTDCGASLCVLETSCMSRPWPTGGLSRQTQTNVQSYFLCNDQLIIA